MALVLLKTAGLEKEKYRLGHTKVFFRAGVLGMMEEVREERLKQIITWLQSAARGALSRCQYNKLKTQKVALLCVQRAIRNYMAGKTWLWWKLWQSVQPDLRCFKFTEIKEVLETKRAEAESKIAAEKSAREGAEAINNRLEDEKKELVDQIANFGKGEGKVDTRDALPTTEAHTLDAHRGKWLFLFFTFALFACFRVFFFNITSAYTG